MFESVTTALQSITNTLQSVSTGPAALPLAFLLGLLSAVASACCTLPAMGMLVAYSGTREDANRKSAFASALSFMIGTTVALIVLGFVAGFVGQSAQALLGRYWKLFAGFLAVALGLAALKLLPLKPPQFTRKAEGRSAVHGMLSTVTVALLMGGGVAAASMPCNPGIYIVIGASVLMGQILWGMVLMAAFGVGFSLPLGAILFGVAFGKASIKAQKVEVAIRGVAGVLLVCAGFYLLGTF
jgi:cytochrome c biogenesis protein CcdA